MNRVTETPRDEPAGDLVVPTVTSDDSLRRAAALGDTDAFAEILDRHGPAMFRYARRLLNDHGDAEEVVQDAFVAAWKALPDFRGDSSLRTWLFTITGRKAVDVLRKKRPTPIEDVLLADVPAANADPAEGAGLLQALDAALAQLPYLQRAAWLLREVEQLSYAEIATALNTTPTVVRGQLARGRTALQERLEEWR
ncbi:RNA polymerase sigma factor [Kribbella sp. DT2]|uniref:RNA polymerase sigma factor n=1 Tax=Kribbella sp. DT2 TaxID=3393427 RepID=UPI003CF205C7